MVVRALAFSVLLRIAQATVGVKIVHGVTHIYGNSFGVPGLNLTYDYIVSKPLLPCSHVPMLGLHSTHANIANRSLVAELPATP
jgi:hypothetical protein